MTPAMAIQYNSGYGESSGGGINDMMNGWMNECYGGWSYLPFFGVVVIFMRLIVSLEKLYYLLFYDDVLLLYLLSPEMNLENTCCLSCVDFGFPLFTEVNCLTVLKSHSFGR